MDALLRRPAPLVIMLALALLGQAATALADGRDVLADAQDNRIDDCYSREELNAALDLARTDQRIYAVAVDVIKEARLTHVNRPGVPCGTALGAGVAPVDDDSGGSLGVWIGVAAVVGAVAAGAGLWAARAGGTG